MPRATKTTKVSVLNVETIIENEKQVTEVFIACFSSAGLTISEIDSNSCISITRDFLPEFLAALQTTYPDAFALIDKHQKAQKPPLIKPK
jgi:hypothetical protein